ncbi:MAG: anaerobic ribonucleoside-triphosphate reductase activating protein [Clostridia bacterium]
MIIDFLPVSLNDYPGKIATTVFTAGCNFKCPYCHNAELIKYSNKNIDKDFFQYIESRKNLIKAVCITGGEPTLHSELQDFCKKCNQMNLSVKLDTNGTNPKVLEELINNNLIDYVAMDIKTDYKDYCKFGANDKDIQNIKKSINLLKTSNIDYEFRITVHPKLLNSKQAKEIAKEIFPVKKLVLQAYKYSDGVLDKDFCGKTSCPPDYLEQIKKAMNEYIENISLRV